MNYGKVEEPSSSRSRSPSTARYAATSAILTATSSKSDRVRLSPTVNARPGRDANLIAEDHFVAFRRRIMSSNTAEIAMEAPLTSNPLDAIPNEIPFDVPYGLPISLEQAQAVIQAAVAEAKKRNWKMNVAVADSGGNLVAFQRMDGAMLASIQIAEHKARAAVTFRRPTKVFEDGVQLM